MKVTSTLTTSLFGQTFSDEFLNLYRAGLFRAAELDELRQNGLSAIPCWTSQSWRTMPAQVRKNWPCPSFPFVTPRCAQSAKRRSRRPEIYAPPGGKLPVSTGRSKPTLSNQLPCRLPRHGKRGPIAAQLTSRSRRMSTLSCMAAPTDPSAAVSGEGLQQLLVGALSGSSEPGTPGVAGFSAIIGRQCSPHSLQKTPGPAISFFTSV